MKALARSPIPSRLKIQATASAPRSPIRSAAMADKASTAAMRSPYAPGTAKLRGKSGSITPETSMVRPSTRVRWSRSKRGQRFWKRQRSQSRRPVPPCDEYEEQDHAGNLQREDLTTIHRSLPGQRRDASGRAAFAKALVLPPRFSLGTTPREGLEVWQGRLVGRPVGHRSARTGDHLVEENGLGRARLASGTTPSASLSWARRRASGAAASLSVTVSTTIRQIRLAWPVSHGCDPEPDEVMLRHRGCDQLDPAAGQPEVAAATGSSAGPVEDELERLQRG
jgi:hypothetical protein